MSLSESEIAHWREWIGKTETREEHVDPQALARFAAAIGESEPAPSLGHWALFLPTPSDSEIGLDGHPKRGGFLPPISLPRRMFAASVMRFDGALDIGASALQVSTVADVTHKAGRSGDLMFVQVERRIEQGDAARVSETQTIVYRDAGEATPAVADAGLGEEVGAELWRPGAVALFRFSAATNNAHRIHYDLPYATGEEGYPGLVVQGPFIAAKLAGLARRRLGRALKSFSFRALAPCFANQPVLLAPAEPSEVKAVRADGQIAMAATFA
jgi:3-methylfumaryl-CoA hydratase